MVPITIIPAIPRSLEKRKFKEDVRSDKDGGGSGSPIRPISPKGKEESPQEPTIAQTQAMQNGASNGVDLKEDVQGSGVQQALVEATENAGSEKMFATVEGNSTFQRNLVRRMKADSFISRW